MLLKNPILGSVTAFSRQHYSYYDDIYNLSSVEFLNFTGIYDNVTKHWQDLKEVVIKKLNMNSGLGVLQTITMTIASIFFGYLLLKGILYVCRRRKNKRCSYGQRKKITDNTRINYEKDGAAEVNIRIVNDAKGASEQQDNEIRVGKKDKKAKRAKSKTRASWQQSRRRTNWWMT